MEVVNQAFDSGLTAAMTHLASPSRLCALKTNSGANLLPRTNPPLDVSVVADDNLLLQRLRACRLEKAYSEHVPAFMIAHDSLLRNIVASCPRTRRELLAIKGMGTKRAEKYGAELLALVREVEKQ